MEMAIIGLGKMGASLAEQGLKAGIEVYGLTRGDFPEDLISHGLKGFTELEKMISAMPQPRKIFLYIPAGPIVEDYVNNLSKLLTSGDVVIDGGNSYWGDSLRRSKILSEKNLYFVDLGTSGGVSGAREGACFMAGGERAAYELVQPLLTKLSAPDACAYVGPSGTGHMVKLIHNGIEFGMLQAIGEGMALLEKFKKDYAIDMNAVFKVYRNGSVIRSWLIDLLDEQYQKHEGFAGVPPYIEDTGEVNWLVNDALHLEVPIPVISHSVMELFRSRDVSKRDYQAVAMMRHGFGGHPFGSNENLKDERRTSRIDENYHPH
jgi:6-phosphogluconate dehydrogenase